MGGNVGPVPEDHNLKLQGVLLAALMFVIVRTQHVLDNLLHAIPAIGHGSPVIMTNCALMASV